MSYHLVYVTAASLEQANVIGRALVEERLAACANILPNMTSIYRWHGRIEQGCEVVLIAKTQSSLVERITRRIKELHSYECPCVVALAIHGGNPEFLTWIQEETS